VECIEFHDPGGITVFLPSSLDIIILMKLTLAEVEHIAELARLDLTPEEKERYRQQLSAVLEHAARLQEVDTSQIPPTSSVLPPRSVLRERYSGRISGT
jgi:aspartyl/glutamyl-tRNA(Asn/Gln) amidotransferase C subunit